MNYQTKLTLDVLYTLYVYCIISLLNKVDMSLENVDDCKLC